MTPQEKKEWAATLLRQKEKELGRLPRKEDFDQVTRARVKAFLGPWPRALEAAGLKPSASKGTPAKKRKKAETAAAHTKSGRRQGEESL